MGKNKKFLYNALSIIIILIVGVTIFAFLGKNKRISFCDEIFTYTIVNSHNPLSQFELGKWMTGDDIARTLVHNEGDHIDDVLENVKLDMVHPPIYYIGVYIFSKLAGERFSVWTGLYINLIAYLLTAIFVWLILYGIFKSSFVATVCAVIYMINPSTLSNLMLIRMYMLYTLWVVAFAYGNFLLTNGRRNLLTYGYLMVVTVLGYLTQYYFAIFAVIFFVADAIYLYRRRRYAEIFKYLGAMIGAVVIATLLWKTWITAVTGNVYSSSMKDNALGLFSNIGAAVNGIMIMQTSIFGSVNLVLKIVLLLAVVVSFILFRRMVSVIKLIAASLIYGLIVGKITPAAIMSTRYFYAADALEIIFLLIFLWTIAAIIYSKTTAALKVIYKTIVGIVFLAGGIYLGVSQGQIDYYPNADLYDEQLSQLSSFDNIPWIVAAPDNWVLEGNLYDFTIPRDLIQINEYVQPAYDERLSGAEEFILATSDLENSENAINRGIYYFEQCTGNSVSAQQLMHRNYMNYYLCTVADNEKEIARIKEFVDASKNDLMWIVINPDSWYEASKYEEKICGKNLLFISKEDEKTDAEVFEACESFVVVSNVNDTECNYENALYYFIRSTGKFAQADYIGKLDDVMYYLCTVVTE